jgi:hypothetical protein
VKVGGRTIAELVEMPIDRLLAFYQNIELN